MKLDKHILNLLILNARIGFLNNCTRIYSVLPKNDTVLFKSSQLWLFVRKNYLSAEEHPKRAPVIFTTYLTSNT